MASNRANSAAPTIAEIQFDPGNGTPIPIPAREYLQAISVEMSADRVWSARLDLWDAKGAFLERLIIAAGQNKNFRFQFDWDDGSGFADSPTFDGFVTTYAPTFEVGGTHLEINLLPRGSLDTIRDRQTRGWAANEKSISDIFLEIAHDRKWRVVDKDQRPTVQPTKNSLPETSQVGESDLKFIMNFLAPYATDKEGRGGYSFFVDSENVFHFHNAYFGDVSEAGAHYVFARARMGQVISFQPEDASLLAAAMGAGNTVYEALDAVRGHRLEIQTTHTGGVPDVPQVTWRDGGFTTEQGEKRHGRVTLAERDADLLKARVTSQWEYLSRYSYPATLVVMGTHKLRVFDPVIVEYRLEDNTVHYLSGTFQVLGINHTFGTNGWQTELKLMRRGLPNIPGLKTLDSKKSLTPQDTAKTEGLGGATDGDAGAFSPPSTNRVPIH